jgi:quercetin dioxygenase-like cupin family protein
MLGPIRRVVTGHDAQGRAIVTFDSLIAPVTIPSGAASFAKLWTSNTSPVDNNSSIDEGRRETGLTCPGGTVLRIVDIGPGKQSPMHRTLSLDYGLVLEGCVDMELDNGKIVSLSAGDIIVQRGTIHAWINSSTNWCRMAFVLIEAKALPYLEDDKNC